MIFSKKEIIEFWGQKNLTKAKLETLKNLNICEESKKFLIEIGLPKELDLFCLLKFKLEYVDLPYLEQITEQIGKKSLRGIIEPNQFLVIGLADKSYAICIDTFNNGWIVSIDLDFDNPSCFINSNVQFINSNVQKLAESLISYQQHNQKSISENLFDDEDKYNELTQHLENQLKLIDSKALEREDNWWAEVIEQMYDGLM